MPRAHRTRKEIERFLISEFLQALRYQVSRPNWNQERPDALVLDRDDLAEGRSTNRLPGPTAAL